MSAIAGTAARIVPLSVELRSATAADHQRAEAALGLPERLDTVADLSRLLQSWRSVWCDVRSAVADRGDEAARLLVSAVRAEQQLDSDLGVLGSLTDARSAGSGSPQLRRMLETAPGIWAVSYVLRGSRVGGTAQAPAIVRRLHLPEHVGTAYLADHTAGPSWVAFRGRLDRWGRTAGSGGREAAVRLAGEMFALVAERLEAGLAMARPR